MTDVFPLVVERAKNYASLYFLNQDGVLSYRLRASNTLNDAYVGANPSPHNGVAGVNGTEILFEVNQGQFFRSHAIRQRGVGLIDESYRNQTRLIYDPDEYYNPPTTTAVPPDKDIAYLRVQTATVASGGAYGTEGPILILQSPTFAVVPRPALSLYGTAPNVGAAPGVVPPPDAMEFRVPFYGDSLVVTNHDAGIPLLISMGRDIPMMQVDTQQNWTHTSGQKDSLVVAGLGGNPNFSVLISTVQGAR